MAIVDRVRNICVDPGREWSVIEHEPTPPGQIVSGYLAPLAALGAVAGFIGGTVVGASVPFVGTVRQSFGAGLVAALYGLYLLYLGLPVLMKAPREKAIAYTAVVVICTIVVMAIVASVLGLLTGAGRVVTG